MPNSNKDTHVGGWYTIIAAIIGAVLTVLLTYYFLQNNDPSSTSGDSGGKDITFPEVTIINNTSELIHYILNDKTFELEPSNNKKHTSKTREFYLEFDEDPAFNSEHIARYYLTRRAYSFYYNNGKIGIVSIN